ncbi:hypothetical protein [Variovorax sp. JS1663]|uniref:hypothetical protein n=1 Tax=Variovorax sp. JS1663 TaxID=1851577 RepID=UPI000B3427FC|nr:hypothetical protein [Variovorax sp. JS1663]OUM01164.1 hypothetical protein A8M77_17885 [Variovorax sp. JS1663]
MKVFHAAALSAGLMLVLAGCARMPLTQPVKSDVLAAMQPMDVKIGVTQSELYASFVRSNAGAAGAAGCGAVPGIGILLAAACGGAFGAVDAGVNAQRAKEAEERVRPLKDELVDLGFDPLMRDSVQQSLTSSPRMQLADLAVTKSVSDKAYEELFKASTSNAVMFVTVDYRLSPDFSALELSARSMIYPRSPQARTVSGLPATAQTPAPGSAAEPVLAPKNAVYRASIHYRTRLPAPGADIPQNVATWKADNARLLRAALHGGIDQAARLLADDLQRQTVAEPIVAEKFDIAIGNGVSVGADVIRQDDSGSLYRAPDGSLHFHASLEAAAAAFDATRTARAAVATSATNATPR